MRAPYRVVRTEPVWCEPRTPSTSGGVVCRLFCVALINRLNATDKARRLRLPVKCQFGARDTIFATPCISDMCDLMTYARHLPCVSLSDGNLSRDTIRDSDFDMAVVH